MNSESIKKIVGALGQSYGDLLKKNLIPETPLEKQYEDSEWLTLDVDTGVDLEFWGESKVAEKLHIVLIKTMDNIPAYQGELPPPFSRSMDKTDVRSILGTPEKTKEPFTMPVIGLVGGWDYYAYPDRPDIKVFFNYTAEMKVDTLSFILMNPDHD